MREVVKEAHSMSTDVYRAFIRGKERHRHAQFGRDQFSLPDVLAEEVIRQDHSLETV